MLLIVFIARDLPRAVRSSRRRGARADGHGKSALSLAIAERYGAKSSTAIRRPSIAGSTSGPTSRRWRTGAASRTT
jgi:hypothetical protein